MGVYRAAMDIGTNSCRLIVAEIHGDRDITHLRQVRITRIGEGLGQGNLHISRAAMDRTLEALIEYRAMIDAYTVDRVRLLGTQALREADNADEFAAEVKAKTGFDLEIISGRREAYLSYSGAVSGLKGPGLEQPLVLDIGAGSTELFWEDTEINGEKRVDGASAPIGALRLLEHPLSDEGIREALTTGWHHMAIPPSEPDLSVLSDGAGKGYSNRPLVAVGGTATTLGAIYRKMDVYDPEALLGLRMSRTEVEDVVALLEGLSMPERLALPGMMPGREDVMPWGLRILLGAMSCSGRDSVVICDRDLLYGILYE